MNKPITHKENFRVITDFYLNWKQSIHTQIKKHPKSSGFSSLRSTFHWYTYSNTTYLSNPFFSNFWGVGLGTLSNSLFFGDPQNWSPLEPTFKKRDNISEFKKMLTLCRVALAPARKLYRIELLFTHKNGDFGAISVTERSCAAPISKVESYIG